MGRDARQTAFTLCAADIDRFSQWLEEWLSSRRIDRRGRLRIRLLAEELLLRFAERFGEDAVFTASTERMFRPRLRIELAGEPFNPLREATDENEWNSMLRSAVGVDPRYNYTGKRNVLRIELPSPQRNPAVQLVLAALIGCAIGLLGKYVPGHAYMTAMAQSVLPAAYLFWEQAISAMSGPVIFFMVITTVLNTRLLTLHGGSRGYVIGRYFLLSLLVTGVAMPLTCAFMLDADAVRAPTGEIAKRIFDWLLSLVPSNIVDPFLSSNTPQLLLIAFVLGSVMLALGSRIDALTAMTRQINDVGMRLCRWLSELVPVFTGIFLTLEIWTERTVSLPYMWLPLVIAVGQTAGTLAFAVLAYSIRLRVNPLTLSRKIGQSFLFQLRSGGDAFEEVESTCVTRLGVNRDLAHVSLPQGLVLYMPVSSVGVLAYSMYACTSFGIRTDMLQLFATAILSVLLFVATPPVPGANLLAYSVLFRYLGIPTEALIDAMVFDVLFGIIAGAGNTALLELETAVSAQRIGLLERKTLAASAPKRRRDARRT